MATIQKLTGKRGTRYRALIRIADHPAITKTFKTKGAALDWVRELEGDKDKIDAHPAAEARRRTLGKAIDSYVEQYTGRDPSNLERLAWWKDTHGKRTLASITRAFIRDALDDLAKEPARRGNGKGTVTGLDRQKSPATINRYHIALSSVLAWCVDREWLTTNPAKGIKRRTEPRGRVRWLSDDERTALLKVCRESEWDGLYLFVTMALSTGARQGELLGLRWADVDLSRGVAYLTDTKNGESRTLSLVKPVLAAMKRRPRRINAEYVFHSPRDPKRPHSGFRPYWAEAVKAAGLEDFRFHDLRHSCASYLAMSGASQLEIADILGHKTLAMVKRYSHLSDQHKGALLERVTGAMLTE